MKQSFDQDSCGRPVNSLGHLKQEWFGKNDIPREVVVALVGIVPGMGSLAPLCANNESERIHECKYELQDLMWDCLWGDEQQ